MFAQPIFSLSEIVTTIRIGWPAGPGCSQFIIGSNHPACNLSKPSDYHDNLSRSYQAESPSEILDMPPPGPIHGWYLAISDINTTGTGIHSTTRYLLFLFFILITR